MNMAQIVSLVLLAVGVALLLFGLNATDTLGERLHETVTGRFTQTTTWYLIGGIAAIVAGGALALFGRQTTA